MKRRILFRCDGGKLPQIGTGHLVRCLLLADEIKSTGKFEIAFLMKYSEGIEKVLKKNYRVYKIDKDETLDTIGVIEKFSPQIVVIDKLDTDEDYMREIKKKEVILITLDDLGPGQEHADITINGIRESDISIYEGPEYVIIPQTDLKQVPQEEVKKVFLCFGGYDYLNITLKAAEALKNLENVEKTVVISKSYANKEKLEKFVKENKGYHLYQQPKNFGKLLDQADVAIVSGGLTFFEAMARGIPTLVIAQYDHQTETGRRYERRGAAIYLGKGSKTKKEQILSEVESLIEDPKLKENLRRKSIDLVDGKGLERVSNIIKIIEKLEWDTNFFGTNIATLHALRINENIINHALDFCRQERVECLYYLSDCHDSLSVKTAEKYGFHFVDIRLTFEANLEGYKFPSIESDAIVRGHKEADIKELMNIAKKSYIHSRYYFDRNFSKEICEKFYSDWIRKSCHYLADKVFVAELNNRPVGYITCNIAGQNKGIITLVGVAESARRRNIGSQLVYRALEWFHNKKVRRVEVVTQGRNYQSIRLYQKCGFKTSITQLWYHKWFNQDTPIYRLILERRSIRRFKENSVPFEIIKKSINAARMAPSSGNRQPLEYIVIDNKKLLEKVFNTLKWAIYLDSSSAMPSKMERPTAYIIMLANKNISKSGYKIDTGCAVENLILALLGEGVGSCCIGSIDRERLRNLISIPKNYGIELVVALGYPKKQPIAVDMKNRYKYWEDKQGVHHVPKRKLEDILHRNHF